MSIVLINNMYLVPLRKHITIMIRGLHIILLVLLANVSLFAQPAQIILDQQDGRITFAVDQVSPADNHFGWIRSASEMAVIINRDYSKGFSLDWTPNIIASSSAIESTPILKNSGISL